MKERRPIPKGVTSPTPRLLRRQQAAHYLGVSVAQLDVIRAMGQLSVVPVPSRLGGSVRLPLFDLRDLDRLIEDWKVNKGNP